MFKRIISFVLVIAIVFCFAVPSAFAITEYYSEPVTWGDYVLTGFYNYGDEVWDEDSPLPFIGTAIKGIATSLNGKICEKSHNGYHASLAKFVPDEAFGIDDHGRYAVLTCEYCGDYFRCYSSDLIAAHDEYVASLDSTVVSNIPAGKPYEITIGAASSNYLIDSSYEDATISFKLSDPTEVYTSFYFKVNHIGNYTFNIPTFTCLCGVDHTSVAIIFENYNGKSTSLTSFSNSIDNVYTAVLDPDLIYEIYYTTSSFSLTAGTHILSLNFEPYLSGDLIHDTPETETRTGSLMQTINNYNVDNSVVDNSSNVNYYIAPKSYVTELIDNSIDIEQCTSPAMYDEETLVFTVPGSGYQILTTGWTYDYTTRTYDISVAPGTTTSDFEVDVTRIVITYGDDTVYFSLYLADGTLLGTEEYAYVMVSGDENFGTGGSFEDPDEPEDPGENPEEETHKHSYTDTVTTEPTCEAPGIRKYTCSECGDSYTEKINAAGHTWTVKQSVATQYDDTGAVTVQGYTIYKCSVCNTEYKDEAGTGPPNNSADNTDGEGIFKKIGQLLGSILSGLLGMIEAVLGGLLDGLVRLANLVGDKLTQVVEIVTGLFDKIPQLFGGFTALLGDVFVFIPEDIMTIFTFGAAAIVFVGILMLFIKR